jgi:ubiquitin C-terminal hydrolase
MQQDAHEFLNFLINHISEIILGELNSNKQINA